MSLTPRDTFHPLEPMPDAAAPFTPQGLGRALRLEDLLRLLLAGALVMLGGFGLGSFTFHEVAGRGTGYFVVAAAVAVVFTALAYYQFEACVTLFIAVIWIDLGQTPDLATGVSSGTGKALYPVELAALFLLFIWALRRSGLRLGAPVRTPMTRPLWIYIAFSVWTAINGALFWDPALLRFYAGQPGGGRTAPQVVVLELTLRFLSIGTFWLLAANVTRPEWLRRASLALIVPGALTILSYFHILPIPTSNWSLILETPLACGLWAWLLENPSAPPARRVAAGAGILGIIAQVFLINITWISGWMSLFAGLLFIAFVKSKRLFAGLVCLGLALILSAQPFLHEKIVRKVQTSGDLDRLSMMRGSVLYALHFPLGIGPGNYRVYNAYYGSPAVWNTSGYTSAHNFYAQALSEMGVIGLLLTLLWVVTGLVMLARFYTRMAPGFSRTATLAIGGFWAGVSAASTVGDYLIPVYHNGGLGHLSTTLYAWIALGLAVAHARASGVLVDTAPAAPLQAAATVWTPPYPRRLSP